MLQLSDIVYYAKGATALRMAQALRDLTWVNVTVPKTRGQLETDAWVVEALPAGNGWWRFYLQPASAPRRRAESA